MCQITLVKIGEMSVKLHQRILLKGKKVEKKNKICNAFFISVLLAYSLIIIILWIHIEKK